MIQKFLRMLRGNDESSQASSLFFRMHIDTLLISLILIVAVFGFLVLYSASNQSSALIVRQAIRLGVALIVMIIIAQIPPKFLRIWSPILFAVGLGMLLIVIYAGDVGKGAKRWLDIGFMRFQPSELMKLAVPMMIAWYLHFRPLPAKFGVNILAMLMLAIPTVLIFIQPDLGTALLIAASGIFVILLAGLSMRFILSSTVLVMIAAPVFWYTMMHDYQKRRVLTFLNPESDPLGSGYHIIQSKIAIGSGGVFGKGWLNGTQGQLEFLPERTTDFIFAVLGEEFGLMGLLILLSLYLLIIIRGLVIASQANDTYERLLAGSISLTFFVYVFVNTGMVTGLLPVVGVPLPLISYGGTSMVTLMAGFGILMSIQTHKRMFSNLY
jgi:rod shape determining protein RodA